MENANDPNPRGRSGSHSRRTRRMTSALVIVALACGAAAVPVGAGPVIFGAKAGLSISNQNYEYDNGTLAFERDPRTGLAVMVLAEFNLTPVFSLQPELGFVQRGSSVELIRVSETSPEPIGSLKLDDRVDYIVFPVHVKAILPAAKYRPYVLAGPRIDWKINDDSESSSILAREYETFVYGGSAGIGLEYGYGPVGAIVAEFVYQFDFSDAASGGAVEVTNESFLILLGYTF